MDDLKKQREEVITQAFHVINAINFTRKRKFGEELKKHAPTPTPSMFENAVAGLDLLNLTIDLSFKLYITHHINTKEEISRLRYCIGLLSVLNDSFGEVENTLMVSTAIQNIKMVFPLLTAQEQRFMTIYNLYTGMFIDKKTPNWVLDDMFNDFKYILANLLFVSLVSAEVIADFNTSMIDFFKSIPAHRATAIESKPYWPDVKPIFERCAAKFHDSSTVEQMGFIFNRYFYADDKEKADFEKRKDADTEYKPEKIELILRLHGIWEKELSKKTGRMETDSELRSRMRRNCFKTFRSWYKRQQQRKRPLKEKIDDLTELMEKTLWKRRNSQALRQSIGKMIGMNQEKDTLEILPMINDIIAELDGLYDDDPGMKNQ